MNALTNHYSETDGRFPAAVLMDAVIGFMIEELSDARGGTLTMFPVNEMEDMTAVFRSDSGSVLIAQMGMHDLEPKTIDLPSDQVDAFSKAISGKEDA